MNELGDEELVARYRDGDGRAFDAIVDRYERRIYAIAMRICREPEDARDVTQDVFLTALRALAAFRGESQLSTWFHRVAANSALDLVRKRSRRRASSVEDLLEQPADEPGPEAEAIGAARAREVHRALGALAPDQRAVVVLHDLQGLDYAECAAALDVPLGTVKSRLHRARVELAGLLGHLREAEPMGEAEPEAQPAAEPAGETDPLR